MQAQQDGILCKFVPHLWKHSIEARKTNDMKKKENFPVTGLGCAGCAARVSKILNSQPGVIEANVNFASSTAQIEYDTENFKDETPTLDPSRGEKQGSRLTSVALSRKVGEKRQRIMVVGNSDCFNNAELQLAPATFGIRNFARVTAAMRWLSDNRYPVKLTRPKYEDTDITVTPTWFFRIRNIYTYLIPAFIGLCGLAVWLRRRRG